MNKKHIFLVDDVPALRFLLQQLPASYGYTSETAENGRTALAKLAQEGYDAVLLDYMMPDVTGLTVLHYIRRHYPLIRVVMITGNTDGQMAAKALAAGAQAILHKSFDHLRLKNSLERSVGSVVNNNGVQARVPTIS